VEIYYHHAPAFRRVSLRLFGIGISLVYCLIHLHTLSFFSENALFTTLRLIADSEEQRIPLRKITDLPKVEPRCGAAPS
jgi:hypothetical protein